MAWKSRTPDGSEYLSANAKGYEAFTPLKAPGLSATVKKELYRTLRSEHAELDLPAASSGPAVDAAIRAWESANVEKLTELPETLQTNFFGFNSAGKMSGLFDFVLITADLRASEESSDVKTSIIGRILERTIDRTSQTLRSRKLLKRVERPNRRSTQRISESRLKK